jgi:5S rRNA maturation endonuclease (ribonuclease M5)
VKYAGREIDVVALWSEYVDFPPNLDASGQYLQRVRCPNPNHDTLKFHFQINQQDGLVHCFASCGISGTFEHALCVIHGLYEKHQVDRALTPKEVRRRTDRARREAKRIILKHSSVGKPKFFPVRRVRKKAETKVDLSYETYLPQVALEFLRDHYGINSRSIAAWNLGWDGEEQRIVIPAEDLNGQLRLLIRRAVLEKHRPKYLYTEGFPKTSLLFGACKIDIGMVRSVGLALVEGSTDAIKMHQNGFPITGGILGTGISKQQVQIVARLRPRRIYLMFDKDTAGITNIEIAAQKLKNYPLFVCRYPKHCDDPGQMTRKEAERSFANALPLAKFAALLHQQGITRMSDNRRKQVGTH